MTSFRQRSNEQELLDRTDIPFEDIRLNMQELDRINHLLGGHAITKKGFRSLVDDKTSSNISVLEIGCGGGDNLRVIRDLVNKKSAADLHGVDINPACIGFASGRRENEGITFHCSDYAAYEPAKKPDIIFSSLFCHHFNDEQLVFMLQWMKENARKGFFINDLHRHPLAFHSIRFLTKAFSKSYLVKNDAPLSVRRGFRKNEWEKLLKQAGITGYTIEWCWAFRWLIIVHNE